MPRSRSNPDIVGLLQRADKLGAIETRSAKQHRSLPDWVDISAFTNSWVSFSDGTDGNPRAAYWRDNSGIVRLRGMIKSGTLGLAAFTLPVGFRPGVSAVGVVGYYYFAVMSNSAFGHIYVSSDGVVSPQVGDNTYFSLAGISFRAEG